MIFALIGIEIVAFDGKSKSGNIRNRIRYPSMRMHKSAAGAADSTSEPLSLPTMLESIA
jgi:hypothetical protein